MSAIGIVGLVVFDVCFVHDFVPSFGMYLSSHNCDFQEICFGRENDDCVFGNGAMRCSKEEISRMACRVLSVIVRDGKVVGGGHCSRVTMSEAA